MKIANIMLGSGKGGIEQAIVDTSEALRAQGHAVTAFIRQGAAIAPDLDWVHLPMVALAHPHRWNLPLRWRLGKALRVYDLIILHGNRAGALTSGLRHLPPVLAVVHSRFFKPMPHFSALLALSPERARQLNTPYIAPNLIRLPEHKPRPAFRTPPVIGAMGRLSPEKGMDILLDALHTLRWRGVSFSAIIGGVGGEEEKLHQLIGDYHLIDTVTMLGWVEDKSAFYAGLDLFVLPSRSESFSITLIEAMGHSCPVIATRCGGPQTILEDGKTGVLVNIDAEALADALEHMLHDPNAARTMGDAARTHAEQHYAIGVVGKTLSDIAAKVVALR